MLNLVLEGRRQVALERIRLHKGIETINIAGKRPLGVQRLETDQALVDRQQCMHLRLLHP
jgi:hypothetical protein